ncbi:class I SAM-dependent methyltransferase [Candidatus Woesebacteria bacterium]|nr:class I SAM-dependent methyltransferase [Candidatus Woesebacteria bacterium]
MMDFNERVIPGVTANFLYQEALARYKFASDIVKKGFKVLDVGSGTGYGSYFIATSNKCFVYGVDINKEAMMFSRSHYKKRNIKFIISDVLSLPFKNKEMDVVISFEVIEHIKDYPRYLKEIKRVLKDNGKFILSTPNKTKTLKGNKSSYHVKEFGYEELNNELNTNFKTVKIFGQNKSPKAKNALREFMNSQKTRQRLVDTDIFQIRKIFPRGLKEYIWKYFGAFFGRGPQEQLNFRDFPITKTFVKNAEYFVAICQK